LEHSSAVAKSDLINNVCVIIKLEIESLATKLVEKLTFNLAAQAIDLWMSMAATRLATG
jgi:hypothetical protein